MGKRAINTFKYYVFLIIVGALIVLSVSCGNDTEEQITDLTLITDNEVNFEIIYPKDASATVMNSIKSISKAVSTLTGTEPVVKEGNGEIEGSGNIFIGYNDHPDVKQALTNVGYYQYLVTVINNNIVIASLDDSNMYTAAEYLSIQMIQDFKDGNLTISSDLYLTGSTRSNKLLANIPYFDGGTFGSTHDCDDDFYMIIIYDAQKEEYEAYTKKIEERDFSLHASNNMNGNLFSTYLKNNIMLHTYYVDHSNEVRVIVAENANLPLSGPDSYTKVTSNTLVQLNAGGGMGYLYQLEDGSFLIIDGGQYQRSCADDIYKIMKNLAPDPNNIVISAWILTHGHMDHTGAFMCFAEFYGNNKEITIKSLIYNMNLTKEHTAHFNSSTWSNVEKYHREYYPSVPFYKALTGQKYYIANAEVEFLYCMQDYMPNIIEDIDGDLSTLDGDSNIQSLVFTVTVAGQKFTFLADTTTVNCNEICARYGNYLTSDFVQMAHHGIYHPTNPRSQNATKEIYSLISPDYALWPSHTAAGKMSNEVNAYLKSIIKQWFTSGGPSTVFELPYIK